MKIQFDPNLDYQQEAIKSVTDIFEGQEVCSSRPPNYGRHTGYL